MPRRIDLRCPHSEFLDLCSHSIVRHISSAQISDATATFSFSPVPRCSFLLPAPAGRDPGASPPSTYWSICYMEPPSQHEILSALLQPKRRRLPVSCYSTDETGACAYPHLIASIHRLSVICSASPVVFLDVATGPFFPPSSLTTRLTRNDSPFLVHSWLTPR